MDNRKLLSIGVAALLVGSGFGGAFPSVEDPSDDSSVQMLQDDDDDEDDEEEDVDLTRVNITAREAIAIAENETDANATVVELELEAEDDDGNETLAYAIEFGSQNGTEREVLVDATDGTVIGVETDDGDDGGDDSDTGDDSDGADDDGGDDSEETTANQSARR